MKLQDIMNAPNRHIQREEFAKMDDSMLIATLDDYVYLMTKLSLPDYLDMINSNGFAVLEAEIDERLSK